MSAIKKTVEHSDRISEYTDEEVVENLTPNTEIATQKDFYKIPRRFGSIPVDELPLGCDHEKQYYKIYPRVALPFQNADRVSFGHPKLQPNRLFWGDNLHVMRMLPSNSIDLIYIDPPFFSGANYNVIFGDQNEVRSFSDIWEGGMPSYLIWLNARLLEMKRLLKETGSIYVHLDWHASHYVKIELDKIFGYDNFINEIVWYYRGAGTPNDRRAKRHDIILWYAKQNNSHYFNPDPIRREYADATIERFKHKIGNKRKGRDYGDQTLNPLGKHPDDVISDIQPIAPSARERLGYPTQKPISLLEEIIKSSSNEGDVVADFFVGGGGIPAVAQKLNRRWMACDQSRVAVAITQGRLESLYEKASGSSTQQPFLPTPDISVEYWGTYEIPTLEALTDTEFRGFVVSAYGGRVTSAGEYIHGFKRDTPLFVGASKQDTRVKKEQVLNFAREISETKGKRQGNDACLVVCRICKNGNRETKRQEQFGD